MKKKVFGPLLAVGASLLVIVTGYQNCGPYLAEEEAASAKKSAAQYPSTSTIVGLDPLPSAPSYSQAASSDTQQGSQGSLPVPSSSTTPIPVSDTEPTVEHRVCQVQYATAVETSFDGQLVPEVLCVQRFEQFATNSAFDALQLSCSWGGQSCGSRGPVIREDLRVCRVQYGSAIETSFDGQLVTRALCDARYNQFLGHSAFDGLQLQCSFGGEICGSRVPIVNQVHGPCLIGFAGMTEQAFGGQMVTRELCVARYDQFVTHPAFNPYRITCTFNNSDHCGSRDPL